MRGYYRRRMIGYAAIAVILYAAHRIAPLSLLGDIAGVVALGFAIAATVLLMAITGWRR